MKHIIKKFVPRFVLRAYHFFLAYLAALRFGFPSKDMVVIGVLGTRGKTTVANLIWSCLDAAGYVAGLTGTANIRIGKSEKMNPFHMTMPGRFAMQRMLSEMRAAGCRFAIVETPSEGVEQWRTVGIAYDVAVMTTLYPEYLETHNWSFERCKEMHQKVFATLKKQPYKRFQGKKVPKTAIVNADIEEKDIFLKYPADAKITYAVKNVADMRATDIQKDAEGRVEFSVGPSRYMLGIRGDFNVSNGLAAIACASALGIRNDAIQKGLRQLTLVPGRMEEIKNNLGISVFVDYAHDAISLEAALSSLTKTKGDGRCIVLTGGQGGGRDKEKRPIMGQIAARYGEYVVIANEDPYDDDPEQIMEEIARGSESEGKIRGKNLFLELDRRNAIRKAISLSKKGDIVFIGGKGSEQSMMVSSGKISWDDREVVREELKAVSLQQ
jgi:UDP-N-acetylmuramoyl-L-alanyl-D-glutamate--2,6-diaminopimelate ligase